MFLFKAEDGVMVKSQVDQLYSTHEEADSRMIFHLSKLVAPCNVVIRTIDTDVLIIALGSLELLDEDLNVWMETGLYSKNTLRYINISELFSTLGTNLCNALPAYHAFTGCDFTSSFSRKGKVHYKF